MASTSQLPSTPSPGSGTGVAGGTERDSIELSSFTPAKRDAGTPDKKGKRRQTEGQDTTTEDDAVDDSDAEVEGLLNPGSRVELEDSTMKQDTSAGRARTGVTGGRQPHTWWGRIFGSMTRSQRKLFFRELATQVSSER